MAQSETYPVGALRAALERTAADPDLPPDAKRSELLDIRGQVNHLLGYCDSLLGEHDLSAARESLDRAASADRAAEDAGLREELIRRGMATPEQCDAMGLPSHDEILERAADGSLAEGELAAAGNGWPNLTWTNGTAGTSGTGTYSITGVSPDPEPEPEPPADDEDPETAGPGWEGEPLAEAALVDAFTALDGQATEVVVSPDGELIAKRIVQSEPAEPGAPLPPLTGLLDVRVDPDMPPGAWRLAGGDAGPG